MRHLHQEEEKIGGHLHQDEERGGPLHQEEEIGRHLHQEEEREGHLHQNEEEREGHLHQEEEKAQEKGIVSCFGTWKFLEEHCQSLQINPRVLKFSNL